MFQALSYKNSILALNCYNHLENSVVSTVEVVEVTSTAVVVMPSNSTRVVNNTVPVLSFVTGTNPLLADMQWSPWMCNPLLSLQAKQAAYMLGIAGSNQAALLNQLNEAGQFEQRSSPANNNVGPVFYTGLIKHRSLPAINNAGAAPFGI